MKLSFLSTIIQHIIFMVGRLKNLSPKGLKAKAALVFAPLGT